MEIPTYISYYLQGYFVPSLARSITMKLGRSYACGFGMRHRPLAFLRRNNSFLFTKSLMN